jgi:carbon-monoxide dehydrogenase large subunit
MSKIAAHMLGIDEETEMVFENEKIHPRNDKSKALDFTKVAETAYQPMALPQGMEPTIYEYTAYAPKSNGFPFGAHIAVVEVDQETGAVKLLKYFAVDDCAGVLNPLVVEGQVHGGVAQGIGQAMLEQVVYDADGQMLTSTLADYMIPTADSLPHINWERTVTPTDSNLLGIKGMGEAGAIAATPTIVNAVEDALAPYNVVIGDMPLRPDYLRSLINKGR